MSDSVEKQVELSIDRATLGKIQRSATFEVYYVNAPKKKMGSLSVGQGGLYWRVGKEHPHFVSWEDFEKWAGKRKQVPPPKRLSRKI